MAHPLSSIVAFESPKAWLLYGLKNVLMPALLVIVFTAMLDPIFSLVGCTAGGGCVRVPFQSWHVPLFIFLAVNILCIMVVTVWFIAGTFGFVARTFFSIPTSTDWLLKRLFS